MKRRLLVVAVFVVGTVVGFLLWNSITLPFSNPHHVMGVLVKEQFNPNTNYLRYGVFILLPVLALLGAAVFAGRLRGALLEPPPTHPTVEQDARFHSHHIGYGLMVLFTLLLAAHWKPMSSAPPSGPPLLVDNFHDGEALAPYLSSEAGQLAYRDYYVVHGMYQDPGRAATAFALFGRSLAALRTLESVHMVITFMALAWLLLLLFRGNYLASLVACAVLCAAVIFNYILPFRLHERDALNLLFLAALVPMARPAGAPPLRKSVEYLCGFALAFIPWVGFAYSIDRGFFIGATWAVLWPMILIAGLPNRAARVGFFVSSVAGAALGIVVLGWAVNWALADFLKFCLKEMPAYKELMDGAAFSITSHFRAAAYRIYILTFIAAAIFWFAYRLLQVFHANGYRVLRALQTFLQCYMIETAMIVMGVFTFRYGLGRGSREHIAAGAAYITLFLTFVLVRHYLPRLIGTPWRRQFVIAIVLLLLAGSTGWNLYRLASRDVVRRAYPLGVRDDAVLTGDYRALADTLRPLLSDRAQFVTLTNEGSWYYFLSQNSPVKFAGIWFGATDYFQQNMVGDLRASPVRYLLYSNAAPWNAVDGVLNVERLPILFEYVRANFHPWKLIGSQQLWIRNGYPDSAATAPESSSAPQERLAPAAKHEGSL